MAHNVLTHDASPSGYKLLICLQSYLALDMYTALEVHTTETIERGRNELKRFMSLLEVCLNKILHSEIVKVTCYYSLGIY